MQLKELIENNEFDINCHYLVYDCTEENDYHTAPVVYDNWETDTIEPELLEKSIKYITVGDDQTIVIEVKGGKPLAKGKLDRMDYIWEVNAYYDENLRGLADDFVTNDWEEVKDKVHEFVSDGHVVEIWNRETGVKQVWESDGYFADFNGESPLFYDDFYAGVKEPKKENKTMKLNLGEERENPYKGNFGGERTNYQIVGDDRYMNLYSKGNDKKPDELFNDVTSNYITDKEDLEAIQDLLWANNRDDEAEIVGYYIDEIDEEKKYGDDYSVARMKIDLALDNYFGGFEQVPIGENLLLSCWEQDGKICINIEDFSDGKYGQVYNVFTPEEIMNMSREDFDRAVNDTWYYGEPNYDYDDED